MASSGIAATLLPGGRTAHFRSQIPIKLDQYFAAGIKHGSDIAKLIKQTSLIIWDEAPMQHYHAFEAVDRSFKDIMSAVDPKNRYLPFGGIIVVFGGDFRQILPVIPKATRSEVVNASLNQSRLWNNCQIFLLRHNMRLGSTIFLLKIGKSNISQNEYLRLDMKSWITFIRKKLSRIRK